MVKHTSLSRKLAFVNNTLTRELPVLSYSHHNTRYGHRCYSHTEPAIIQYDPPRPKPTPYWCIAHVDPALTAYYRTLFQQHFGYKLYPPAFDAHVSILRGMPTPKMDTEWGFLNLQPCTIHYDHRIWYNQQHVWLNTYFDEYFQIRAFYEVPQWNTQLFGHITIGKFTP